jgi:hypothetical protein
VIIFVIIQAQQDAPTQDQDRDYYSVIRLDMELGPTLCVEFGLKVFKKLACIEIVEGKNCGRAAAQAISAWLPTAVTHVRARFRLFGICGGQCNTGRFSRSTSTSLVNHPTDRSTLIIIIIRTGTIGQIVADVSSRHSLTPPQENKNKTKKKN